VTGKVLEQELETIRQIYLAGHEIAIHSLDHQPLWQKNKKTFATEIKVMKEKIFELTGKNPIGHRAVNFSLDQSTAWALKVLSDSGLKYDSSLFPFHFPLFLLPMFKKQLYGSKLNNFVPYNINLKNLSVDKNSVLKEFPISVFHFGKIKLPLTGGIYIRLIPWFVFKTLLKIKLRREPACIHFHPFDFAKCLPNIKMPWPKKFIKYFNTKNTWKKLEYILNKYQCISAEKYYYENTLNQPANRKYY